MSNGIKLAKAPATPPEKIESADLQTLELHKTKVENIVLKIQSLQREGTVIAEKQQAFIKELFAKYSMSDGDAYDSETGKITRKS